MAVGHNDLRLAENLIFLQHRKFFPVARLRTKGSVSPVIYLERWLSATATAKCRFPD